MLTFVELVAVHWKPREYTSSWYWGWRSQLVRISGNRFTFAWNAAS